MKKINRITEVSVCEDNNSIVEVRLSDGSVLDGVQAIKFDSDCSNDDFINGVQSVELRVLVYKRPLYEGDPK